MLISDLAKTLGGELCVPQVWEDTVLVGVGSLAEARQGEISFLDNLKYEDKLSTTQASAVLLRKSYANMPFAQIIVSDPYLSFARVAQLFVKIPAIPIGVSPDSLIHPEAVLGSDVRIEAGAVVCQGAKIGDRTALYGGSYVAAGASIGSDSVLRANVVVEHGCQIGDRVTIHAGSVIGADGFGYAAGPEGPVKIPQLGIVIVDDDVEIGAGTTIDRATMGATRIGRGTKIDSAVHVGHNVQIGKYCFLCGGVAVAGSVTIGDRVTLAGQVGVNHHVTIGSDIIVGGKAGVTKNLQGPGTYMGFPAIPEKQWRRQVVTERNLEDYVSRIKQLEGKVSALEKLVRKS